MKILGQSLDNAIFHPKDYNFSIMFPLPISQIYDVSISKYITLGVLKTINISLF